MDAVLDRHFAGEAAHDLAATLATLAEDVEHDVVGLGVRKGHAEVAPVYQALFDGATDEIYEPIRRMYGDDFMVDEVMMTQTVVGDLYGVPGNGTVVTARLLHVLEFRDGLISRENVWMDTGAIIAQLTAAQAAADSAGADVSGSAAGAGV
ncbi:hypothetical protein GCM10009554_49590 [Kribbella koreensis]|uniref:SnoaL-like domain-containing protein n=2 Tax=Kribbella koreensis TaxID=57909 RepID=A0ABP4BK15_9ACTN